MAEIQTVEILKMKVAPMYLSLDGFSENRKIRAREKLKSVSETEITKKANLRTIWAFHLLAQNVKVGLLNYQDLEAEVKLLLGDPDFYDLVALKKEWDELVNHAKQNRFSAN
ncbi:hypothetical protein HN954_04830 [bacterium]|jgi:hypothetical protein|nr:hypothetical protein [bacterium]MBT6832010.1 hypothetical protein [bacterium]MBT6996720.1 hypothetical protein [bacterium]MBT7772688.1 hypothetical protein [bacterium]